MKGGVHSTSTILHLLIPLHRVDNHWKHSSPPSTGVQLQEQPQSEEKNQSQKKHRPTAPFVNTHLQTHCYVSFCITHHTVSKGHGRANLGGAQSPFQSELEYKQAQATRSWHNQVFFFFFSSPSSLAALDIDSAFISTAFGCWTVDADGDKT